MDIITLTDSLTAPYSTETEKARAIFAWLGHHIAYDCGQRNRFLVDPDTATHPLYYAKQQLNNILTTRRTRCEGYSFMFKNMCWLAGIYCTQLEGYGRFTGGKVDPATVMPNHSWNAALLDGVWYEIDPTLGAGACNGSKFIRSLDDASFCMSEKIRQKRYIRIEDHRRSHNQGRLPIRFQP